MRKGNVKMLIRNLREMEENKQCTLYDVVHSTLEMKIKAHESYEQPYFKVKQDESSEIDSHSFITKTKAALPYYSRNITGNTGTYQFESRARDDSGLWADWTTGANFQITAPQNNSPNNPSFQNVPNTIYQNQQINIIVKSWTDADNYTTRVK